jgi:hypothetical protein
LYKNPGEYPLPRLFREQDMLEHLAAAIRGFLEEWPGYDALSRAGAMVKQETARAMGLLRTDGQDSGDGRRGKRERDRLIRELATRIKTRTTHGWAELAAHANQDEDILKLNGGKRITRDVARNVVIGDRKRGGKRR